LPFLPPRGFLFFYKKGMKGNMTPPIPNNRRNPNYLYYLQTVKNTPITKVYSKGVRKATPLPDTFLIKYWDLPTLQALFCTAKGMDPSISPILGAPKNDFINHEIVTHKKETFCDCGSNWLILDFDHKKYTHSHSHSGGALKDDLARELAKLPKILQEAGNVLQLTCGCLADNELAFRLYFHITDKIYLPQQKAIASFLNADTGIYNVGRFIFWADPISKTPEDMPVPVRGLGHDRWFFKNGGDVDKNKLLQAVGGPYNLEIQTALSIDAIRSATVGERRTSLNNEVLTLAGLYATHKRLMDPIGPIIYDAAKETGLTDSEIQTTIDTAIADGTARPIGKAPREREMVLQIVLNHPNIEIFTTKDDIAYLYSKDTGIARVLEKNSTSISTLLTKLHMDATGGLIPTGGAVRDAIAGLLGAAAGNVKNVAQYSAFDALGHILLDLGDNRIYDCMDKMVLEADTPLLDRAGNRFIFLRDVKKDALPVPLTDREVLGDCGVAEIIEDVLPGYSADTYALLEAWLRGAMVPDIDYPILLLQGSEESGKSLLSSVLKSWIDPRITSSSEQYHKIDEKKPEDFVLLADRQRLTVLDNVGHLDSVYQDVLCCMVTGGAINKRKLYTDAESVEMHIKRPIIISTINKNLITQEDLLSRTVKIELPRIQKNIAKNEILAKAAEYKDAVLGCLINGLYLKPALTYNIRFSEFIRWGGGADLFETNKKLSKEDYLNDDIVATALNELLDKCPGGVWEGEVGKLYEHLNNGRTGGFDKNWPSSVKSLGRKLYTLKKSLEENGNVLITKTATHSSYKYVITRITQTTEI
jgi:hypothetical protein